MGNIGMAVLFCTLTLAFGGIAVAGANAGYWVIVIAAGAIALWMGSFAFGALKRIRRR